MHTPVKRDKIINLRVTAEEKAVIAANAGSVGTAAYLRQLGLNESVPVGSFDADADIGQDRAAPAASPATSWKARVRQLEGQGLPSAAAQRIADQEFRGGRVS